MKRVLTAVALMPVVAYVVLLSPRIVFLGVLVTVAFLCYYEYDTIAKAYGFGAPGPLGYVAGLVLLLWPRDGWFPITVLALIALAMAMRAEDLAKSLPRAALLVLGVVYVFGCWRHAIPLRQEFNPHWLMFALLVNWAGDIGAYYVGRNFGKHALAPRVSPKKTWEGAAASVATSVLLGGAYLMKFVQGVTLPQVAVVAVLANVAGQLGDLSESAIKRGANMKDSGAMLPGHGGFLDRVDSTLFALPVVFLFLKWLAVQS